MVLILETKEEPELGSHRIALLVMIVPILSR